MSDDKITLDQLQPGQSATIRKVGGAGALRHRLMDMGLIGGTPVVVVKRSPLGDPIDYLVRGYHLTLRKSEAQMIEVTLPL